MEDRLGAQADLEYNRRMDSGCGPVLSWLPQVAPWDDAIAAARAAEEPEIAWRALLALANSRMDFLQTAQLDRAIQKRLKISGLAPPQLKPVCVALLGSSTLKHLVPSIRVAGLRRGLLIDVFEGDYGQYLPELLDNSSALYAFQPQFICFAFDAPHLLEISAGDPSSALERLHTCWKLAMDAFACTVLQQTVLPVFPDAFGNNEHRLAGSPQRFVEELNRELETAVDGRGTHLLSVHKYATLDGLSQWHDPALWLRTRQEIHPGVAPLYGDFLVRMIAAQLGRSAKCLVLDLDNTLWGGVIGDDGIHGIVLGPGSPAGEAFCALQSYALRLKERGVLLAICSKNDEQNALSPFELHAHMVLKRTDIACFVANWNDKASNLRYIAATLNIGIDSLVFVDDNPFERNLIRQELPEVAVLELPEDPALYTDCIARSGYFEALALTAEDRARAEQYRANSERESLRNTATDLTGYLRSLAMQLSWSSFDEAGLQRIVQLINKTNQFNLTTRRYSEAEVRELLHDADVLTWQLRLKDRFGDNGVISLLIARLNREGDLEMDSWLMSCRVLGREVEQAALDLVVAAAKNRAVRKIIGIYRPTPKNTIVKDMYSKLGFSLIQDEDQEGTTRWALDVVSYVPRHTQIQTVELLHAGS
ncbi:MAG TPA: HAD-IIIC family phosphatase [Acidobacteriaceae bacterium]|nr:HAD-IIIC family phosphatase [Acidobacteriaceae bacterium]